MEKKTSWGGVSKWYDDALEKDSDSYQAKVIGPNLVRIAGKIDGKNILDIACGQGYFSRILGDKGAHVIGADISPELITYAKKKASKNIEYFVAPSDKLGKVKNSSTDLAIIILALQNIENVSGTLSEAFRILKSGGKLVIALNHPTFRVPQSSDWGFDEIKKVQYRKVEKYMSEQIIKIQMNPGKKDSQITVSFHRPLQYYFKAFNKAGFCVTRLEEWISHKASEKGPRQAAEDKARKEIPLFMCIELLKP
jgi:ubiquinone/menaquinone biosynthesis C-methylase UbiE